MAYGIPSGPYYPYDWREKPYKRPGKRVVVLPNDEIVFHDREGMKGTLVNHWRQRDTGRAYGLVYFDHSIDLNCPLDILTEVPQGEHLFAMRNRII